MSKVLLHACCAVCASWCVIKLKQDGFEPIVYFYNPNIEPFEEYNIRLNELIEYSKKENFKLIIGDWENDIYKEKIKGLEHCQEKGARCIECFKLRFEKTAKLAQNLKINNICTTLTISPHKVSKDIFRELETSAQKYNLKALLYDFKKQDGFKKAQIIAKENNMYKQTYCGCVYSIRT